MLFIFDMGGVLIQNFDVGPDTAKKLGISVEELRSYMQPEINDLSCGRIEADCFWEAFSKKSGIKITEDYLITQFKPILDQKSVQIVKSLKKYGRVVCGTNTIDKHYRLLTQRGDFSVFDKVYASHIMGLIKPDLQFWNYILDKENTKACDAFFTDDSEENIKAASKIGLQTLLFTTPEQFCSEIKEKFSLDASL